MQKERGYDHQKDRAAQRKDQAAAADPEQQVARQAASGDSQGIDHLGRDMDQMIHSRTRAGQDGRIRDRRTMVSENAPSQCCGQRRK